MTVNPASPSSLGPIVCNSSPLIVFDRVGRLDLVGQLFAEIVVPPAVVAEVVPGTVLPPWAKPVPLGQPVGAQVLAAALGPGESEAIALGLELNARLILLDDRPARRLAQALHLPVIGTLGLLLAAKRRGLIPAVKPVLDDVIAAGFRVAVPLVEQVLRDAGE